MSTPTPAGDMDPIPGDPSGIRRHATRFTSTATAIRDAVELLQSVRAAAEEEQSDAVEALAAAIGDTRDRLHQIRDRYEVAGSELTTFADVLEDAQRRASGAITAYGSAQSQARGYEYRLADARDDTRTTVDPSELQDATQAVTRYSNALDGARGDALAARAAHGRALADVRDAGDRAAAAISRAVDGDGLNDSAWDNLLDWVNDNAGWLAVVKDILTVITAIVGVLSIFFPVLLPLALGLSVLTAGLSFLLAASGDGSWIDFGLDVLGILTLGVGSAALAGIKVGSIALRGTRAVRLAVTQPGTVWGSTLRQVAGNLLDRGLMQSVKQPFTMVVRESASVVPARPGLMQVATGGRTPWMNTIRDQGSVVIAEFDQIAANARLGAGGLIDNVITWGADGLGQVHRTASTVGNVLDGINFTGMGLNYSDMLLDQVAEATGVDSVAHDVVSFANDVYRFLPDLATGGMPTEWTAPVAP